MQIAHLYLKKNVVNVVIVFLICFFSTLRKNPGESFFDTMPTKINDETANYAPVCSCQTFGDPGGCGHSSLHVPSFLASRTTPFNLCDKHKRDIHYSDELTDEDYELFKTPLPSENQDRFKRALPDPVIPKENATRYCTERIADTEIGKICAGVGVDVQAFVDSCSLDVSVSTAKAL